MFKLEELIQQLCPDGVEYNKLTDVADVMYGFPCDASKFNENKIGIPLVRIRDVLKGYTETYTTEKIPTNYYINDGDFLVGMDGYFNSGNWKGGAAILCQRTCKISAKANETLILNRFLSHLLGPIFKQIELSKKSGTVKHLLSKDISAIMIPVPPLEVQHEIVRILDQFTDLSADLSAELTARKKQYEYYREKLFSFAPDIQLVKLNDIAEIKGRIGFRGYTSKDIVEKGNGAISLSPSNIYNNGLSFGNDTYISWDKYFESPEIIVEKDDIIFCKTGSTLGKVAIVRFLPEKTTINPQLVVLKNIKCNNGYLKHYMTTYKFQSEVQQRKGLGSVPNISQAAIGKIDIPLPSKDMQDKITLILDRFDALCNDMTSGLPAEIAARQKQYEYYRDKLLTFKKKSSDSVRGE